MYVCTEATATRFSPAPSPAARRGGGQVPTKTAQYFVIKHCSITK